MHSPSLDDHMFDMHARNSQQDDLFKCRPAINDIDQQWKLWKSATAFTYGYLLTQDGYAELTSIVKRSLHGKYKIVKQKINFLWLFSTFIHITCEYFKRITLNVAIICFLLITHFITDKNGLHRAYLIVYFLLLRGGVELNPGPPVKRNTTENKEYTEVKKRVRKSGKRYCGYLTDREPLQHAPRYIQKEINANGDNSKEKQIFQSEVVMTTAEFEDANPLNRVDLDGEIISMDEAENTNALPTDSQNKLETDVPTGNKLLTDQDKSMDTTLLKFQADLSDGNFSDDDTDSDHNMTPPTSCSSDEESESVLNFSCFEDNICETADLKDLPVYEGARISTGASMLLHITFALQENLTGNGLCKLLNLTEIHCKENNTIPTS
ncbi:uncharacterized protein [Argopecten irradians]|uniref:uncharacterized protein n=1 Tax=Argopecten irradians TaxID=31199 RepID=UPI00371E8B78